MRGLLVRVGIDKTYGGWNAPCRADGSFCYVPMKPRDPEDSEDGFRTTYDEFETACGEFMSNTDAVFPNWLHATSPHLDPDFRYLTYGDGGRRAARIRNFFDGSDDNFIAFYASFRPVDYVQQSLVYAIMGFYRFRNVIPANQVPVNQRNQNAHTRVRAYEAADNTDIVVFGGPGSSGRLTCLLPIGEQRVNHHYYVRKDLFDAWGGISSRNGWIQRSAYLPHFCEPERFLDWFNAQSPELIARNNTMEQQAR